VPAEISPLERLFKLLTLLLETRVPLTQRQLVHAMAEGGEAYGSTPQAQRTKFERDKSALRSMGVPISTTVLSGDQAGETAYFVDRDAFELKGLQLDDDERDALQLALALNASPYGQSGLWKLGGATARPSTMRVEVPVNQAQEALRDAVRSRSPLSFSYRGVARRLDPYGMLLQKGWWYLIGFDHGSGEQRTYRVDRIEGEVEIGAPDSFARPDDFDARAAMPSDPLQIGDGPDRVAQVWVAAASVPFVTSELGADAIVEHRGDGSIVAEVPFTNVDAFRSWSLGHGAAVEVLAPADVRAAVVAWLRSIATSSGPSDHSETTR
jgi:proteasome accessory factor B